jgi:beta-glucuronidase
MLVCLCAVALRAECYPQIINVDGRVVVSLNGTWRSIVDPYEDGYYNSERKAIANGYGKDKDIPNKSALQEYSFADDRTIAVPADWNSQRPELYYYEGTVWYRKRFDYLVDTSKRAFLYFGAVNYEAIVFVNGKEVAQHVGGFTPFNVEVSGELKDGENSVVVKVDNKRRMDGVPTLSTDWWNYGGITRDVKLLLTPKTFIRDYYVQLKKGDSRTIEGWVQLDGKQRQTVRLQMAELNINLLLSPDSSGRASFTVVAKPTLWTPENPKLYAVSFATDNEQLSDQIGFRTLATQGTKILLNGKEIFCRGVSLHEEAPYRCGRAYSADDAQTLLQWAKDMGCNFVRLAHYPHNEQMVRTAERMGLMVWSEIPVYWGIQYGNPATYRNAEQQLTDMVVRDKNRANVVIWSLANETPRTGERFEFLSRLANKARSLDPVRLLSAAMQVSERQRGIFTVEDSLSTILDIFSFNQYVGWYDGLPEKCDRITWQLPSDKPVFVSEFGGGALYGMHGDVGERFTEEFQEDLYRRSIAMLERIPQLAGVTPWILMDFRSPRRHLPGIQDDFNRKGLISEKGQKKKAYFVMREWYLTIKN